MTNDNALNLNLEIQRTFAMVRVQPPTKLEEVDDIIDKLKSQAEEYEQKGDDELKRQDEEESERRRRERDRGDDRG